MSDEQSPLPWRAWGDNHNQWFVFDAAGAQVCHPYKEADARLIVQAANAHHTTTALLRESLEDFNLSECNPQLPDPPDEEMCPRGSYYECGACDLRYRIQDAVALAEANPLARDTVIPV